MKNEKLCRTRDQLEKTGELTDPPYSFFSNTMRRLHNDKDPIQPHSDVYYVRYALYVKTGFWFPLNEVESAMKSLRWKKKSRKKEN
jgi:hypothetical protein